MTSSSTSPTEGGPPALGESKDDGEAAAGAQQQPGQVRECLEARAEVELELELEAEAKKCESLSDSSWLIWAVACPDDDLVTCDRDRDL